MNDPLSPQFAAPSFVTGSLYGVLSVIAVVQLIRIYMFIFKLRKDVRVGWLWRRQLLCFVSFAAGACMEVFK